MLEFNELVLFCCAYRALRRVHVRSFGGDG